MEILRYILYEIAYYGSAIWALLAVIAISSARFFGRAGVVIGALLIGALILALDVRWIFDDMRIHPENGRDADGVFIVGVFLRFVLFNLLLTPFSLLGLWLAKRHKTRKDEPKSA